MIVRGKIVSFDQNTWWGEVTYDMTVLPFHGTTVHGAWPDSYSLVGREVEIHFNHKGNLLSLWLL